MKFNVLVKGLLYIIVILIIFLATTMGFLPWLIEKYESVTGIQVQDSSRLIAFLYLTAFPFAILLMMSAKLCRNILNNKSFSLSSYRALVVIGICAFGDFFFYALGTIFIIKSLLALTLMIAAFMVGLVSLVLAQLVKVAVKLKEENELTI